MKRIFAALNAIMAVVMIMGTRYYGEVGTLRLKGMVSSLFVLLGVINLVFALCSKGVARKHPVILTLGLILAMSGDIWLGIRFPVGVLLFALGHVMYIIAFSVRRRFGAMDLAVGAALTAVAFAIILFEPSLRFRSSGFEAMLLAYAVMISMMLGKALVNALKKPSASSLVAALGSAMFYFSDAMLLLNMFGDGGRMASRLCLWTYFPGQLVLAHSMFYYVCEQRRKLRAESGALTKSNGSAE